MHRFVVFATAFLSTRATSSNCTNVTKPFECFNNSTCTASRHKPTDLAAFLTVENVTLDINYEYERDGYHCRCLKGWTGLRCDTKSESCGLRGHKCYHGGVCIATLNKNNNSQILCDCTHAEENIDGTTIKYVGKYCEEPSRSNEYNNDTISCDSDQSIFCVNGGTCKYNYYETPVRPCNCPSSYEGPHCEFVKGTVPDCTLNCQNNGVCLLGTRTHVVRGDEFLQGFFANHTNYQYCDCLPGFYGPSCETKSIECGFHRCFNGGSCVTEVTTDGTIYNCDCSRDDKTNKSYAGKYCQYESTVFCDKKKTENGRLFCTNNGTCNVEGSYLGCTCLSGFRGPSCEFKEAESTSVCNLKCQNKGVCRIGAKDVSYLDKFGPTLSLFNATYNENFEHCVCPAGYLGLKCEHKVNLCRDGLHACFHGSKCNNEEEGNSFCECYDAFTASDKYAGKYCEFKNTSTCAYEKYVDEFDLLAFCVNGGKCKSNIIDGYTQSSECDCPDEWAGDQCELLKSEESETNDYKEGYTVFVSATSGVVGLNLFGIFPLILVMCFLLLEA